MNRYSGAKNVKQVIYEAVGTASMCWEHVDRAGVFDSDQAKAVAEELFEVISRLPLDEHPSSYSEGWIDSGKTVEERLIRRLTVCLASLVSEHPDPGSEALGALWEGQHYRSELSELRPTEQPCRNCLASGETVRYRSFENRSRPSPFCDVCAGLLSQGDMEMFEARARSAPAPVEEGRSG